MSQLKTFTLFLVIFFSLNVGLVHAGGNSSAQSKVESLSLRGECAADIGVFGKIGSWVLTTGFKPVAFLRDQARTRVRRKAEILPDEIRYFQEVEPLSSQNAGPDQSNHRANDWNRNNAAHIHVENGTSIPDALSSLERGSLILLRARDGRELVGRLVKSNFAGPRLLITQSWHSKNRSFLVLPDWLQFRELEVSLSEGGLSELHFPSEVVAAAKKETNDQAQHTLIGISDPLVRVGVLASLDRRRPVIFFANDGGHFSLYPLGGGFLSSIYNDSAQVMAFSKSKGMLNVTPADWRYIEYLDVDTQVALPRYSDLESLSDGLQGIALKREEIASIVAKAGDMGSTLPDLRFIDPGNVVTLDVGWDRPLTGVLISKAPVVLWVRPSYEIDTQKAEAGDEEMVWKAMARNEGVYLVFRHGDKSQIKKAVVGWAHAAELMKHGQKLLFFKDGKLKYEGANIGVDQDGSVHLIDGSDGRSILVLRGEEVRALEVKRETPSLAFFRRIFGREAGYGTSVFHARNTPPGSEGNGRRETVGSYVVYEAPQGESEQLRMTGVFNGALYASADGSSWAAPLKKDPSKKGEPLVVRTSSKSPEQLKQMLHALSDFPMLDLSFNTFEVVIDDEGQVQLSIWGLAAWQKDLVEQQVLRTE